MAQAQASSGEETILLERFFIWHLTVQRVPAFYKFASAIFSLLRQAVRFPAFFRPVKNCIHIYV